MKEALQLAYQLHAENPDDLWNIRALFWSLHSVWKDCDHQQEKQQLAGEMLALPVPADDQIVKNALQAVRRAQDPSAPVIAQVKELSQVQNHEQSITILEQFLHQHPNNAPAESALSWEIWWQLNKLLREEKPSAQQIGRLVYRYEQCHTVERPSVIHSRMLEIVSRAARAEAFPKFCAFLHWWKPEANIRDEDLITRTNDESQKLPSMIQHIISAIGKTIEDEPCEEHVQTALSFLQTHVPQYDDQEWFPYYMGLALCKAGQLDEALEYLVPFARSKSREFWVWQKLAMCFPVDDPRHLACLCRSVLCGAKGPNFLLIVRQQLAIALHIAGHNGEARHEIETIIAFRQQHGWKIPDELVRLKKEDWFETAKAKDGVELYRSFAAKADDILIHDIHWTKAVLQARDVQGNRGPSAIILVELQDGLEVVRLRMSAFEELSGLQAGAPLNVRITNGGRHKRILALQQRGGNLWDILPEACAVVTRVNTQKGVTSLLLANGETSLSHHNILPETAQLNPGDFVYTRSVLGRDVKHARTIRKCNEPERSDHWKMFEGLFKPREKGGGHVGDVFVAAYLTNGVRPSARVIGVAVKKRNDTGDIWWTAVMITQL